MVRVREALVRSLYLESLSCSKLLFIIMVLGGFEAKISECSKQVFGVLVSLGFRMGSKEVEAEIRGFKAKQACTYTFTSLKGRGYCLESDSF